MAQPYPPGARAAPRPATVAPCATCGEPLGRGYPTCSGCQSCVDAYWLADWQALVTATGAQDERALAKRVLLAPAGAHPWTCTDWALRQVVCPTCRAELATGDLGCVSCTGADQSRWAWDHAAPPTAMTRNEHLLRVAVTTLRAPARHRASSLLLHRALLPFLLTGEVPTPPLVKGLRALIRAGRDLEVLAAPTWPDLTSIPGLPWRD